MFFFNAVISSPIPIFILLSRGTVSFRKKSEKWSYVMGGGGGWRILSNILLFRGGTGYPNFLK